MHFQFNPTPPSPAKVSSKEELAKGQQPSVSPGQDQQGPMAERRAGTKSRRLGSSRRKGFSEAPAAAPSPDKEPPWAAEIVQRVQDFLREQDKDQAGFVTRSDIQKLQEEDLPCSTEELELVFDGLDAAGTGRLRTEEFTFGLWQFLSSQEAARGHRRRKTASRRVRLVLPSPALEEVDSEERRQFAAFMDQLGTDNISEEEEIWKLWVKLRQDEPQLLGNLEDFVAKMRHRIQEVRNKKEALEETLSKRVAEHDKEVQQLCGALEQRIQQEQQWLEQESMARSHQHAVELQQMLDASEKEVQRLVRAQTELETRCHSLRSMQEAANTENQQLKESNRVLEQHLQHLHQQLQQTHGRLQAVRAAVAWEHMEEPMGRAVAELPRETPVSPQISLEKSEKYHSEMRVRRGSQSREPKAKSTHQVVWEMLPAEISLLGAPRGASSAEENPFPESLKEERFSDQSSLLREMNDAIAALSKQLKPQAPGTTPAAANTAHHPQDDAEPHMGLEEATAHGTTPRVLQETLSGHIGHKLFEGDMKEGPGAAPDVTQAGASMGAGHHRAQEPGAEQGESLEEAQRMLFLQGKGGGVKEVMLKVAEQPQGALGENMEAGEQALMEVEGARWMQEKTSWEKAQLLGEAEEVALSQGENLEAGLGSPEAGEAGLVVGQCLGMEELHTAVAQPLGTGLGEEAHPPLGLSKELEINPGELKEPEQPSQGEARIGAAQGDSVLPEVTVAPGPRMLEEERVSAEVKLQRETLDAEVLPAQAQHGAGIEEREVEVTQGESAREDAEQDKNVGAEVALPVVLPPDDVQEGGAGADVPPLEAQSSEANMQLLAEVEAALQPWVEVGSSGTEQGGSMAPDVQPLEKGDQPELGLGEDMGAAVLHSEGPSPAEMSMGSPAPRGLFPVKAQALEMVEAEDAWADMQLHRGSSPETPQGEQGHTVVHLMEEDEDDAQEQGERELPQEPVLDPQGAGFGQGKGAGAGMQPREEAESLDRLEDQSTDASVKVLAEMDEVKVTPGRNTEGDLQLLSEISSLDTEQRGSVAPDVQPLDQVDKAELVALEAENWVDMELRGGLSLEAPWGAEGGTAAQLKEEDEDGAQEQDEHGLPQEPVLDPQGAGFGQGEVAAAGLKPREEVESLDRLEDQNIGANVQALAEMKKLKLTPGGSAEADLQLLSEVSSLDTEQGGNADPDAQPLDQVNKAELVEMEAEDSTANIELHEGPKLETLQGGEHHAALQLVEKDEDGEEGQGECGLSHEPVLPSHGVAIRQGEGAAAGVQPRVEAERLDRLEDQSTGASVQMLAEMDEAKVTPGGNTEGDLQLLTEVSSPGRERGGSVVPDVPNVQTLDQVDKAELVEMEAEDWADMELHGGPSPETPQEEGDHAVLHHLEEDEDGAQEQGESGLAQEPVFHPHGVRQGEGTGAGVQPHAEAVILDTLEAQSTHASVQPPTEPEELRSSSGGSAEGNVGAAAMREGQQSHTPGSDAAHTAKGCKGAAGAHLSPPAEATSHPECAAAPKAPGVEAKLGAPTGPDGQILGYTQTLELPQGERAAAEGRRLDGAQGLEVGQGERLEAGERSLMESQGLGLKQDHDDDGASAPGSLVSEVPLQISTLKLEAMMQEDVLVPDVRRLGASGQAAQSELQEQVSAQAEKPQHVMETEKVAAGPAELPKQEVAPASLLHTRVLQEEDAGNDPLGMVLGGSSLGDAASMQPQKQLLGEQSKDLEVGQWKKQQEVGRKMSQEGEPIPGEPRTITAGGAGAVPRGSSKASLDPDHLYNVLFVGDSHVGKTSFLYRLHADTFNPHLTATVGLDYQVKNFVVDNKRFALRLWDSAGQERYHSITKQFFRKADGVVLMYDITSEYSFLDVQYWLSCIQEHQLMFYECSAASGHNVSESMVSLIRLLKVNEDKLKNKAEEVPKLPQKKKGCCW
ncbi:ras-related protein Rab-44 isoform X2 [Strigops habroptila]|uniref:ras-related protein Rab-44 isoform X2 n=1 Tax=Strigops habroptila TaxID=2489341 RepID=UPI0011D00A5B|nr:ras-related protein Rab-44 isoform X2 [Strigops habroptila]